MRVVENQWIKEGSIERRLYQETILGTATQHNTLVVLPTGLGKTAIAAMLAAHRLDQNPDSKIMFLAPTKPLVEQHCTTWKKTFNRSEDDFLVLTGASAPETRSDLYKNIKFVFATPQVIQNDIISNRFSFNDFSLLILSINNSLQIREISSLLLPGLAVKASICGSFAPSVYRSAINE